MKRNSVSQRPEGENPDHSATAAKIFVTGEETPTATAVEQGELPINTKMEASSEESGTDKPPDTMSPMMLLNQIYPGVNDLIKFGAATDETTKGNYFTCRLEVDGNIFVGTGLSKKEAKQEMARKAMELLPPVEKEKKPKSKTTKKSDVPLETKIQRILAGARKKLSLPTEILYQLIDAVKLPVKPCTDFKTSGPENAKRSEQRYSCVVSFVSSGKGEEMAEEGKALNLEKKYQSGEFVSKKLAREDAVKKALTDLFQIDVSLFDEIASIRMKESVLDKHPVEAMHELCQRNGLKVDELDGSSVNTKSFIIIYKINDRSIQGESNVSKREARRQAAIRALQEVFNIDMPMEQTAAALAVPAATVAPAVAAEQTIDASPTTLSSSLPPLDLINRISDICGSPVLFEAVCMKPVVVVKAAFGKASVISCGGTWIEAKHNAAIDILKMMGIGKNGNVSGEASSGTSLAAFEQQHDVDTIQASNRGWISSGDWQNYYDAI